MSVGLLAYIKVPTCLRPGRIRPVSCLCKMKPGRGRGNEGALD